MEDLIKALTILGKYLKSDYNKKYPTCCEHDVMYVCGVDMEKIPLEDIHTLAELSFTPGSDYDAEITTVYNEDGEYEGDIDFKTISQEDWNRIKVEITDCFSSYLYGSC